MPKLRDAQMKKTKKEKKKGQHSLFGGKKTIRKRGKKYAKIMADLGI